MGILQKLFGRKPAASSPGSLEEAKKIFFDYSCSHFYMSRDGVDEKYARFNVGADQEALWRQEYIDLWVSRLSPNDLEALTMLGYAWALEALDDILYMAERGDSYTKLFTAIEILAMLHRTSGGSSKTRARAEAAAESLLTSVSSGEIWISDLHEAQIQPESLKALKARTAEEYVRNYAARKLSEMRESA